MSGYPFIDIEKKWQAYWDEYQTFRTPVESDVSKPKYYLLSMFPSVSGAQLHVGHLESYIAADIIARYKRMKGFNVLYPMGWGAFGLPVEGYTLRIHTHPKIATRHSLNRFRKQLKSLGLSYDWDREVNTADPGYYKWTQWIFAKLYERGLVYRDDQASWWCPALHTTLSDEEVVEGLSEVGGHPCVHRPVRKWLLRITAYAERLLQELNELDWPVRTKEMQRDHIGLSEGAEVDFHVLGFDCEKIQVFTTRPDTLFGATFLVLAPEHPLVDGLTTEERQKAVARYRDEAIAKSEQERTESQKQKRGVYTGHYAVNPVNGKEIPIWIADYVLGSYGTGAIMGVPGQDERDWEFAEVFNLPIIRTVQPPDGFEGKAYTGDGPAINSGFLNGLYIDEAKRAIIDWLEAQRKGCAKVNFKLRDWVFSRQLYWGEPLPILFIDGEPKLVPESDLPVRLPDLNDCSPEEWFRGLADREDWVHTTDAETGRPTLRETDTMPEWAAFCWYYLRCIDPHNDRGLVAPGKERYWMPVDLYIIGSEYAVSHLLYARFWHKVLYDIGLVSTQEPFQKLVHQGMVLGGIEYWTYIDTTGQHVSAEHVEHGIDTRTGHPIRSVRTADQDVAKNDEVFVLKEQPNVAVEARAVKMSMSRGNSINPDDIVNRSGADSLRLYEVFNGPLEQPKTWSTQGVEGPHRFLNRVWRLLLEVESRKLNVAVQNAEPSNEQLRLLHKIIKKVTEDVEAIRLNTAISALMEFVNAANKWDVVPHSVAEPFALLLSPFAPHLAEELWQCLGHDKTLAYAPWPEFDEGYIQEDMVEIAVQVNGKVRGSILVPASAEKERVLAIARTDESVARHLQGKIVRREIYVPGRIVNFVAS